ncbi:MAG: DUF1553 domain-containing protein, partial [Planctomycetes bacterium]|nr:DUF1553 domain-containing protein [Planctomycetota bacterium]
SQKRLIKKLVMSQTYQMSSRLDDESERADPDNLLWHRMPVKRMEGEVIRDAILALSGRLDRRLFGKSTAIHLTPFMQGRGRPPVVGPLDGDGRRSIYISVRRNFLSPMMLAFDTPSPFSTVGRRTVSNVPAQALILMNDPFVVEQASNWASRLVEETSLTNDERIERIYLTAFARRPTSEEKNQAKEFLVGMASSQLDASSNGKVSSLAEIPKSAWIDLCHVMMNVKEFIFLE